MKAARRNLLVKIEKNDLKSLVTRESKGVLLRSHPHTSPHIGDKVFFADEDGIAIGEGVISNVDFAQDDDRMSGRSYALQYSLAVGLSYEKALERLKNADMPGYIGVKDVEVYARPVGAFKFNRSWVFMDETLERIIREENKKGDAE